MKTLLENLSGHDESLAKLRRAIKEGRLASTNIFSGLSGIGKKSLAFGLSQELLCERSINTQERTQTACGLCGSCLRSGKRQHESIMLVEPQKNQIKIEQAREILHFLQYRSLRGATIVIVDEVEKLNVQAANALLKILEEPRAGVFFFLITSSLGGILPTIRSRSQIWHFTPLKIESLKALGSFPEWVLSASQGSLSQAQALLDNKDQNLRGRAFSFIASLQTESLEKQLEEGRDLIAEKDEVLEVVKYWQQLLRDACVYNINPNLVIHKDCLSQIQKLSNLGFSKLEWLFSKATEIDSCVRRNFDLNIAIEDMVYSCRKALDERNLWVG